MLTTNSFGEKRMWLRFKGEGNQPKEFAVQAKQAAQAWRRYKRATLRRGEGLTEGLKPSANIVASLLNKAIVVAKRRNATSKKERKQTMKGRLKREVLHAMAQP